MVAGVLTAASWSHTWIQRSRTSYFLSSPNEDWDPEKETIVNADWVIKDGVKLDAKYLIHPIMQVSCRF
jgi:hypothetical protein